MQQNILTPVHLVKAASMSDGVTSSSINIQYLDNISVQMAFTGTPTGDFSVQGSLDNANWVSMTFSNAPQASGSSGSILEDMPLLSFPWMRVLYTPTGAGSQNITAVADVSQSLAGKYFFINGGNDGTAYYVWFKVSGTGTDPMVAGKTGIEVDIVTNDTAHAVAVATATAINAVAPPTFSVSAPPLNTMTVTNVDSGPFVPASDNNSGFSFSVVAGQGVLDVYISGKQLG